MTLRLLGFLICLVAQGCCKSEIYSGHRVLLEVPVEYSNGFIGRAFLLETNQMAPNFKAALSIEAVDGKYACSLGVFLGDVKVWSSGHFSRFYTTGRCVLELNNDGDLQLKGSKERVGWRTGTSQQGVERLQLLKTGNLILVDAMNRIKWQSFNFPTDVLLWGQRIDVATHLTSFPSDSTSFYSLEIQCDRIALYLNSGNMKYSYWDFKPSEDRNITFVELGTKGLEVYNHQHRKIAQVPSQRPEPVRFLALGNRTGNLGLYFYSPDKGNFEASFQALNTTCDLPSACKPYGICTLSHACSCIRFLTNKDQMISECSEGTPGDLCGRGDVEMLELNGVSTVLNGAREIVNVSKEACASLCVDDCECVSALYSSGNGNGAMEKQECFLYGLVRGVKQVEEGTGLSYFVKVPKGSQGNHGRASNPKKWVFILVGVADGLIIFLVLGGFGYYLIKRREKNLMRIDDT